MADLDIVGGAAVDVVPIIPQFHAKLKALVLPIADRVGREAGERMGEAISNNIVIAIPNAITRGGRAGVRAAGRQGDDAGGAFARSIRRKLEAAFKAMPKLQVGLADTGVDAELARIRARMETLRNKTIGVDVSTADAEREIVRIDAELRRLGASHADVEVRADTATARAALAEIRAEIAAVDATDVDLDVHVNTAGATGALMALSIQAAALMAIPLGPVLAAGLGAVVSMASAAAIGVGAVGLAAVPAIKGVTEAIQAKTAAEKEAASATDDSAKKTTQAAQRALQLAGAQSSLASAHRNAARSIAQAARGVEDAERSVADAIQRAADQRQASADAIRRAQEGLSDSHRRLRDAQESLTDANRTAQSAQEDLSRARVDAAQKLRDLNDELRSGALDQREATLRVQQAQEDLNRTKADAAVGKATQLDLDQAQLAYDRATERAKQQKQDYKALQRSAEEQKKAGVAGSEAVQDATERLADAQRAVADRTEAITDAQKGVRDAAVAVADAQSKAARDQVDAARTVADAQRGVSDAVQASAEAQVSAADQIASAERGLESARLSGIDTTTKAVTKADEYRKALAKLTPEGRTLFKAIAGPGGLVEGFKAWSKELSPDVVPLFTRAVNGLKNSLPGLTPLTKGAADGIDTLMDKASAQMKTPFWESFKADLAENVKPAVVGFGVAFGNVIVGIVGIIDAFLPKMDGIAAHSDRITERFAKWGTSLKGSPDFEKFLTYVKDTSPGLAEFIGEILSTIVDLSKALAPLSELMFETIKPLLDAIQWLATNVPELVITLWLLFAAQKAITLGMAAFAGAMILYQSVMIIATIATAGWAVALNATGIVPIIRAIVLVVGLLVAAVIYAYKNWDWFRVTVDTVARAIKTAALWIWDNGLKPAFNGIWTAMKAVGAAAVWLWDVVLEPVFGFIFKWGKILVTALVVAFLLPAYLAFKALGAIGMWLWEKAIGPAFAKIARDATWLWEKVLSPVFGWISSKAVWIYEKGIKPAFKSIWDRFKLVGEGAQWLWREVLRPVFGWIGDKASWLYEKGIKPHFDNIKSAMSLVAESFDKGKDDIKTAWDKISGIAKEPVKFIIDKVYNEGIVPLWDRVAAVTGADKLKPFKGFHTGGVMDGYSPGRDDRLIAVSGGEAIMRPEWTRAIGEDRINQWNAAARSGGISGVQRAISAGMPAYKDGGIVGWLKDKSGDAAKFLSGITDYTDPAKLFAKAAGSITNQMKPLMTNRWAKSVGQLPIKMMEGLKDTALGVFGIGDGGGGQWTKPVGAPMSTPFGKKGPMWSSGQHTGLDFAAALGTAVKAVAGGKVAMAKSGGPYGNHIMLNHGGGLTSLYAHLSKMLTSVGDTVKQGQKIGEVGSTGNSSGPHLHLEARVNGKAVDPMRYLTGGGGKGGTGVERWRHVVKAALAATNNPSSYADLTLRRMQQESGGNPEAVNNWDVNAKNGTPSVGLMQVIKPTFEAYAGMLRKQGPFRHGVSIDPMANIFASMRYAKSAYGSLPTAYNRPGGYAEGGFPQIGEMAWVGEKGPELLEFLTPTRVRSNSDSMAMARATQSIPGRGSGSIPAITADVHVYVGDREITDIVRVEVDARQDETAMALGTGRYL
ncbi:peptidoglycan DD-metalloendopeptidase family protein [Streptomyces microflavus]|uniref:peptidoglycan DD-metalloendopeptidase family protein n=1 Tax=Streptomyces TaxID=1883 RepID=UPI0029AC6339|nr:peptidoglycan DD-metalloendopeptidase family protein [Streptomyces sp. NRRL_B-2249]MDX2978143.1 peptidoglycan DD-metalloendopeptidase family protein [Streptomyces sp. NRRL_B-2249]